MNFAVQAESLYVNYDRTAVLWDVSCQIPTGQMTCIVGPNGAGKSTFLKTLLGLVPPISGKVQFWGAGIEAVRSKISYVPQRGSVDWDFPISALEVVLMGRYGLSNFWGLFCKVRKADREAALHALELVGMREYAHRQIGELSGGQQQRIFLARAIVQSADLLLLDEPFAGVDLTTEKTMIEILKKICAQGKTVIAVHHDLHTVQEYFDWVLFLNTHVIACGPTNETFQKENLQKTYGKMTPFFEEAANLFAIRRSGL